MDLAELKEAVEPEAIADYLGLEYQERGGRHLVLCPFHNDTRLGSAYINNGWFHCFSCGESMDIIELIRKVKQVRFTEAVSIIARIAGVQYTFEQSEDNEYCQYRLSKEEAEILQIPRSPIGLAKLFAANPDVYKRIVIEKAYSQRKHYMYIYNNVADRAAPDAYLIYEMYDGDVTPQTYRNIKNEAIHRIRVCNAILERFD